MFIFLSTRWSLSLKQPFSQFPVHLFYEIMGNPFCHTFQRLTTNVDKSSHLFYSAFQTKQSLLKFSLRWKFANLDVQILKTIIFVKYGHLTSLPSLDSRCSSRWARRWFACSGACFLTPCGVNLCCYAALRPFEAMSDCKSTFWEQYWFLFLYLGHTGEVLVVEEDFSRARCS